jgi:hypothetical protein
MWQQILDFVRTETGATAIEYGLIAPAFRSRSSSPWLALARP